MIEVKLSELVQYTCRTAQDLDKVRAKLKVTSKQMQEILAYAEKRGYEIRLREGMIFSRVANRPMKKVVLGDVKPGRYVVGYWSDTHFGCRHSDEEGMIEHRTRCHDLGAKIMVHTGDLLDGNRPVLLADQDYVGWDSQVSRLERVVKKSPPMEDVLIDGNHDGYYSAAIGAPSGRLVCERLGAKWHYAGVCEGRAELHGADFFLWHPHGGSASKLGVINVLACKVHEQDEHIDIMLMGHLHKFVSAQVETSFMCCTGTFQRKASEFANRISGPWDIGGSVISFDLDKHGGVHAVAADFYPAKAR